MCYMATKLISDDTQMTLFTAYALTRLNGRPYDHAEALAEIGKAYLAWYRTQGLGRIVPALPSRGHKGPSLPQSTGRDMPDCARDHEQRRHSLQRQQRLRRSNASSANRPLRPWPRRHGRKRCCIACRRCGKAYAPTSVRIYKCRISGHTNVHLP